MGKTVTIASRIPMAIRIEEADSNAEKPGLSKERRSVVINGAGNALGVTEGFTPDVDEALFDAWVDANPNHAAVVNGLLRKAATGEEPQAITYGFDAGAEPAATEEPKASAKTKS